MLGRLFRKHIKHPFESFNWNFDERFFDLLVLCIAYVRVVFQRSKLHFGAELFAASTTNLSSVRNYRYHKSLDALSWAKNSHYDNGYTHRDFISDKDLNKTYLDVAAQVLLLNSANSSTFGHSFHVLSPSPLPITFSVSLGSLVTTILLALRGTLHDSWYFNLFGLFALFVFISVLVSWILLVAREEYSGAHTLEVQQSFRIGIVLFITSEFMLFVAFFWAFFHFALNPSAFTGCRFVPEGLIPFFWYRIPLVNTVILLSSGMSLTLAHFWLAQNDNALRMRGWFQAIVQGTFLVKNPEKEFISYCDERLLTRTSQITYLDNPTWKTTKLTPWSYWSAEWYRAFGGNGGITDNGPWSFQQFAPRFQHPWIRLYDRLEEFKDLREAPLFRWADDVRIHNAMAFGYAYLHAVYVGTSADLYPARSTRRFAPLVFRFEDHPLATHYETRNTYQLFHQNPFIWLGDTIVRGFVFLTLQAYEYQSGLFNISDSVFGATFYTLTGLHGVHVFVGVLMLMAAWWYNRNTAVSYTYDPQTPQLEYPQHDEWSEYGEFYHDTHNDLVRSGHFANRGRNNRFFHWWRHRVAFDGVAWYWHFVDVVWLFVFIFVYWYAFPTNINVIAK